MLWNKTCKMKLAGDFDYSSLFLCALSHFVFKRRIKFGNKTKMMIKKRVKISEHTKSNYKLTMSHDFFIQFNLLPREREKPKKNYARLINPIKI